MKDDLKSAIEKVRQTPSLYDRNMWVLIKDHDRIVERLTAALEVAIEQRDGWYKAARPSKHEIATPDFMNAEVIAALEV